MEQGREAPGMEQAASGQEPQDQANGASSSLPPGGMGDWLAEHEQSVRQWRRGEVVEGVVVSADRDEFLVDIGAKSEAVVPLGEVPQTEVPSVGETVLAFVLSPEDQEGRVVLSLTRPSPIRYYRRGPSQLVPYARGRTLGRSRVAAPRNVVHPALEPLPFAW